MRFTQVLLLALLSAALPASAQLGFGSSGPTVTYSTLTEGSTQPAGTTVRAAFTFDLEQGWHVHSEAPFDEFLIPTSLNLDPQPGVEILRVVYPEHVLYHFAATPDDPLAVFPQTFTVGVELGIAEDAAPGPIVLTGHLRYQACDDKQCVAPKNMDIKLPLTIAAADAAPEVQHAEIFSAIDWEAGEAVTAPVETPAPATTATTTPQEASGDWKAQAEEFTIAGSVFGYTETDDFLAWITASETGEAQEKGFDGMNWYWIVLAVLAGGFALNLTPCVLPLIPINIAIIGAGARAGSKARGFALGSAYGLGISLIYGLLGLVVVLGVSSTFGTINSTVWFNAGIAVLFVFLGLAMFDVVSVDFSKYQAKFGIRKNENGSFGIALAMGAISALLAGACVAPVVIYTIVYAQNQYLEGMTLALALPFLLGVGMALPWPFAGAGLSFLPKPGMWMTRVKQAFGVFIIGFAVYYGHMAWTIWDNQNADPALVQESVAEADAHGWVSSLEAGLAQAKAENKPVLLDFWATWCKNCLVMNKSVLQEESVLDALDGYVKIKFQAEDPSEPYTAAVQEHFGVLGLPTYIILQPK